MKERMTKEERAYYRRKLIEQKLMGLAILVICAIYYVMVSGPNVPKGDDGTPLVLFVPMGLWLLFSKKILIY